MVPKGGEVVLSRRVTPTRPLVLFVVALVWLAAVALWRLGRRSSDDLALVTEPLPLDPDEGSLIRLGPPGDEEEIVEVDEVRVGDAEEGPAGGPDDASVDQEPVGDPDDVPPDDASVAEEPMAEEPMAEEPVGEEPVDESGEEPT